MPGAAKLIAMSRRRAPRPDSLDRWTRNEPTEIQARSPGAGKHRPGGNLRVCLAGAPGAPACRVRPAADPGRTSAGPAGPGVRIPLRLFELQELRPCVGD